MSDPAIRRALISVTDKTGIVDFAMSLYKEFGIEIISTGGTARVLKEAGVPVTPIEKVTGFPEMMDGRVKTLHPKVHGALLAKRDDKNHMSQAIDHNIGMIDMVVVNLYAFEKTVQSGADFETCIENIDIGGPSMLRSAAKNFESVAVVTHPRSYDQVLEEMRENDGSLSRETRLVMAFVVFQMTSSYDGSIALWLSEQLGDRGVESPQHVSLNLSKVQDLRYGENPHQISVFYSRDDYRLPEHSLAHAEKLQGKELSYNNYLDLDAAWCAVREYDEPACVIVKHLTPCGVCEADNVKMAYKRAHECDPVSAYGGVMAFNRQVEADLVDAIFDNGQFVEAIVAPGYSAEALKLYESKPNARLLATGGVNPAGVDIEYRSVEGGVLAQDVDAVTEDPTQFKVVSKRKPTDEEMAELLFAWKACKSVKSNAIVIAKDKTAVGVGGGQPNRVNSARIAVHQAGEKAQGAVAASDAFFPFRDGFDALIDAGIGAVIQPGGSVRDQELIDAADERNVAMVFTGYRHFRH